MTSVPFLTLTGIHKSFGGVRALTNVSLDVHPGEVHAIVGENGAGKSTLMKIIAGALQPDAGQIQIAGRQVALSGPGDSVRHGVSIVYQEPTFCPDLSVLQNFFLGEEITTRTGAIDWQEMFRRASAVLEEMGLSGAILDRSMSELSIGNQQLVLIARGLYRDARLLILDEPTSILSHAETELLFKTVERLRTKGHSVLYISHRLHEVLQLSDRITVLRDGQVVGQLKTSEASQETMISMMSGRSINQDVYVSREYASEAPLLSAEGLTSEGLYEDVSLSVRPGEVLGIYGLVGSGRSEVAMTLFGQVKPDAGTIRYKGQVIQPRSSQEAIALGICYVPEDRRIQGIFPIRSVADNASAALLKAVSWGGWLLRKRQEGELVTRVMKQMAVKSDGSGAPISSLSGGNQQKVLLGRWLSARPQVLIMDEPTRGVDVGTKTEIHRLVMELAQQGVAIILISSDLPEVLALADKMMVMHEGAVSGVMDRTEATEAKVLRCALGVDALAPVG